MQQVEDPFEVGQQLLLIYYWNVEQDHWKELHIQNRPIVRLWLAVVPTRTPNNQRDPYYVSRMTFLLDHIHSTIYIHTNHVHLIKVHQNQFSIEINEISQNPKPLQENHLEFKNLFIILTCEILYYLFKITNSCKKN